DFAEASRMLARAAEQMTPLLANHSDDVSMTREFAAYRGFAGRAFEKLDNWDAALGAYTEASRLLSRVIVADSASEQDFATYHARCDQTIAMLNKLDRVGDVAEVVARSLDSLERACERFPSHRVFREWRNAKAALLERLTLEHL
ncbi:MAG TPA: hypothetical protein PLV92_27115, partial [Pirellulaceae bacterium]|nr:hypothetical protein [Pirellulaceae bacterium]